jgi:hypothetical protein
VRVLNDGSYNLGKKYFDELLAKQTKKSHPKMFTRYTHEDLIYECGPGEVRTYRKNPVSSEAYNASDGILVNKYIKEKIPFYMFPSTTRIYEVAEITSIVIRMHNNVYLNFEVHMIGPAVIVYKVFVNYNIEARDCPATIEKHIKNALALLQ